MNQENKTLEREFSVTRMNFFIDSPDMTKEDLRRVSKKFYEILWGERDRSDEIISLYKEFTRSLSIINNVLFSVSIALMIYSIYTTIMILN